MWQNDSWQNTIQNHAQCKTCLRKWMHDGVKLDTKLGAENNKHIDMTYKTIPRKTMSTACGMCSALVVDERPQQTSLDCLSIPIDFHPIDHQFAAVEECNRGIMAQP